jgi:hypothetical protein
MTIQTPFPIFFLMLPLSLSCKQDNQDIPHFLLCKNYVQLFPASAVLWISRPFVCKAWRLRMGFCSAVFDWLERAECLCMELFDWSKRNKLKSNLDGGGTAAG